VGLDGVIQLSILKRGKRGREERFGLGVLVNMFSSRLGFRWTDFLLVLGASGLLVLVTYFWSRRHIYLLALRLPGPKALPLLGNAHQVVCRHQSEFKYILSLAPYLNNRRKLHLNLEEKTCSSLNLMKTL
jgi:hypothetical protein